MEFDGQGIVKRSRLITETELIQSQFSNFQLQPSATPIPMPLSNDPGQATSTKESIENHQNIDSSAQIDFGEFTIGQPNKSGS